MRVGNSTFWYNRGVAQGSILSPALFNIFTEDLSDLLIEEAQITVDDLLFYADDILILCSSMEQLRTTINTLEEWTIANGMVLNKKKSGIVVFAGRFQSHIPFMKSSDSNIQGRKRWIASGSDFLGFPIVEQYKYLGTILNSKLTCKPQIEYIKKKSAFLFVKLYPYLANASSEGRKDMWRTMNALLFSATLMLLHYEPWRMTFKQFMLISQRTSSDLVDKMIGLDLRDLVADLVKNCKSKWESRKLCLPIDKPLPCLKKANCMFGVPSCWNVVVNTQRRPCPICKGAIMDSYHLANSHALSVPSLWDEISCKDKLQGISRFERRKEIQAKLESHLSLWRFCWSTIVQRNSDRMMIE